MARQKATPPEIQPTFGPLIPCCKAFGLSRSRAWALVKEKKLVPFRIGGRAFIELSQLTSLPERLRAEGAANASE